MNFTEPKIFLDTNILAYIFDSRDAEKQKKAKDIFSRLADDDACVISTQVLQELFNVLTKKLSYTKEDGRFVIDKLVNLPVYEPNVNDVKMAIDISIETQFSIYDSLIISAASMAGCDEVYSEDLNDGQVVHGVKIVNPFRK